MCIYICIYLSMNIPVGVRCGGGGLIGHAEIETVASRQPKLVHAPKHLLCKAEGGGREELGGRAVIGVWHVERCYDMA
jgi:hypothetical protein